MKQLLLQALVQGVKLSLNQQSTKQSSTHSFKSFANSEMFCYFYVSAVSVVEVTVKAAEVSVAEVVVSVSIS